MTSKIIEIHSFYITENEKCLKGVYPNTSDVITISGPFKRYSPIKQYLTTEKTDTIYYLPSNKIEKSNFLIERTKQFLNKLSRK